MALQPPAMVALDASEYSEDDWSAVLKGHPIFSNAETGSSQPLELSTNSLPDFTHPDPLKHDSPFPSGRRQAMVLKDADLVVAVGKEIRATSLGDAKLSRAAPKSYKVHPVLMCHNSLLICYFRSYTHLTFSLMYPNYL
jgi:hypothetical protein